MQRKQKYHIITYGCQMNEHDSEMLAGMLEDMGYKATDELEEADIILFNTCIIRKNAELKLFGKVGSLKHLKKKNPELIIGIGGCMMQEDEAVTEIYEKYPQVDLIFGTHNIHRLPELIKRIDENRERIVETWDQEKGLIPDLPYIRESEFKSWVTIIQGCNNFCSYCIVPYVRGRERSRPLPEIVREVKELVKDGVKEITLLGQNVNSYGHDRDERHDFADLLLELDKIQGLKRIRYMTSHPRDFNFDLIEVIKNSNSICEHFHLPVQSGSSKILKKMNRGYDRKQYIRLIKRIKEEIPCASITTDFIVGFPGETENDFQKTLQLVKKLKFDMAFTFKFSPRPGTPAADMKEQVPEQIKDKRLQELMKLQNKISRKKNKELLGKKLSILVEGESKNNKQKFQGRSRTNKLVIVPRREGLIGNIIPVEIEKVQSWTLFGRIIAQN